MAEIDCGGKEYLQLALDGEEVEVSILRWNKGKVRDSSLVTMKRRQLIDALSEIGINDGVRTL